MKDILIYAVIGIVLVLLVIFIVSKNRKSEALPIDIDQFIKALGQKENIKSIESDNSKVRVFLKDVQLLDHDSLKALGASGIVVTNDKATIILGKISEKIVQATKKKL